MELTGNAEQKATFAAERARAERVELLRRQVGRRMLSREVSLAWTAWVALCERRWRARQQKLLEAQTHRSSELESQASSLQSELRTIQVEYDKKLAVADQVKEIALERLRTELTGSAAELTALREQQEKEERIEMLRRQVGRRMLNQGLASGWAALYELWQAKCNAMETLRQTGNRLRSPALASAFSFWGGCSVDAKRAITISAQQQREASLERERQRLVGELARVQADADRRVAEMQAERLGLLARVAQLTGGKEETQRLLEAQVRECTDRHQTPPPVITATVGLLLDCHLAAP